VAIDLPMNFPDKQHDFEVQEQNFMNTQKKIYLLKIYMVIQVFYLTIYPAIAQTKEEIKGVINSGQYDVARTMSKKLIAKGDPLGYNVLGWLEEQKRTPAGYAASFNAYLKAAEFGDKDSMFFAGRNLKYGWGTNKDLKRSVFWLEKASKEGDWEAMYELAEILKGGYDYPYNTVRSTEIFNKIYLEPSLMNTDIWVMSAFYLGWSFREQSKPEYKAISESFLEIVIQSKIKDKKVEKAQQMIRSLVAEGKSNVGKSDGSPDDALCQKYGFTLHTQPYSECRMKLDIAKKEAAQRQAAFEAEQQRYQEQVAAFEKEKERQKKLAQMRYGLALMGSTSPTFAGGIADANRAMGWAPPEPPKLQPFTIQGPKGTTTCTVIGNMYNCF
jgi:hypothetical protein